MALNITKNAKSGPLQVLNSVLTGVAARFQSTGTLFQKDPGSLTSGQLSSSINSLNSQVNQTNSILSVKDAPTSLLGNFS